MNIYFSGLGGVGIGPLALIANDIGYIVSGSDVNESRYTRLMRSNGIDVAIGQDGQSLKNAHETNQIDWLVYTAALPKDHPELAYAKEQGIKTSLRGEFVNHILKDKDLEMIAISGTHGKTTTTGMFVWAMMQLQEPISYAVGTNLSFGASGKYVESSKFFVYEADEYAKQFLDFHPATSIITTIEHDHPDTYPTEKEYLDTFVQFAQQSGSIYTWKDKADQIQLSPSESLKTFEYSEAEKRITLPGKHNRQNAFLVLQVIREMIGQKKEDQIIEAINSFPGTERRFEKLSDNLYTDYGHHPTEVNAVAQMAKELNEKVVIIYQPHQNMRQHEIVKAGGYGSAFSEADHTYWLPTYLSREDERQEILTPDHLIETASSGVFHGAEMNDKLLENIKTHRQNGNLVVLITAGDADQWLRDNLSKT